ncbi:TlpA disulfide reductase family protein [Chitinophaga deserti]|uniref:TlpA disulfide reductase family protein n=1 Tax=Chitinophaga deserti TaxID=2164099 RepID=UPI000D6CD5F4|nr:TlpA disulfide reductase family protein [Chitinophaga deserti]
MKISVTAGIGIFSLLLCLIIQLHAQEAPAAKGFVLKGHLSGLPDGAVLYLTNAGEDTVHKAISKGEDFRFTGRMPFGADFYYLKVAPSLNPVHKSKALWLENSVIALAGDVTALDEIKLTGSGAHDEYLQYLGLLATAKDNDVTEITAFIRSKPASSFVPFIITRLINLYPLDTVKSFYSNMTPAVKKSQFGSKVNLEIARRENFPAFYKEGPKGNVVPNFGIVNPGGGAQALHDVLAKHKLTLVDVWASWCTPCREAVPELMEVREKMKSRGFDIIGLSVDDNEAAWKKAVAEDKTPWMHFIDKFSDGASGVMGVWNLPAYFLIDRHGKILYLQNMVIQQAGEKPLTDKAFVGNSRLLPLVDSLLHQIERNEPI